MWKQLQIMMYVVSWLTLTRGIPCPFPCICDFTTINCSSQQLTTFPLYFPPNIGHLDLSDNSIAYLPHSLKDLQLIVTLNLARNNLQELVTSDIGNLHMLRKLDLSMNRIPNTVNINALSSNSHLYHLNLSANPIRDLGNSWETVLHSDSISHLDLSNCALSSINNHFVFSGLTNLTFLNLSGNPLKIIDKVASLSLSHLDLSSCSLYYLRDTTFTDLPNLVDLNLSKNSHLTMLTRYQNLMSSSLLYLDASYCALDQVDIHGFPNLIQSSLKGNLIKVLPDRILQNNKYLVSLDLSENSIHHLDTFSFTGAESLFMLDLSMNFISDFHYGTFSQTPFLGHLNLSRNILTNLNNLSALTLSLLDISKNDITALSPHSLVNMPELKTLNLSQNSIEVLPLGLRSMSLKNLDLSFCRISWLNELTFEYTPSLREINLSGNRLTNPLKRGLFDHLTNLKEINLINNPWHCKCSDKDLTNLWSFLTEPVKKSKYIDELICQFPENVTGQTWEVSCFKEIDTNQHRSRFRERPWVSLLITFVSLSCVLSIMIVVRQAFQVRDIERRQQEMQEARLQANRACRSRIVDNLYEEHMEIALRRSQNETQRSPIAELSKLPTYEEALLLPKPSSSKDLQGLVDKYEKLGRFEHQYESIDNAQPSSSNISETDTRTHIASRQNNREHLYEQVPEIDETENATSINHYESVNQHTFLQEPQRESLGDTDGVNIVEPQGRILSSTSLPSQRNRFSTTRSRTSSIDNDFTVIDLHSLQRLDSNI